MAYQPKDYFFNKRTLEWEKDLTIEQMEALKKGEVFHLLDKEGNPHSTILMDSYNQIRQRSIEYQAPTPDIAIKGINY